MTHSCNKVLIDLIDKNNQEINISKGKKMKTSETLAEEFEPGKRYYFAAYATTIDTTTYGSIESFRTAGPPDVIILYPEYRETTSMRRIIVDIESDDEDGLELTMYWGTDRNNLTEQTYIYYESDWGNFSGSTRMYAIGYSVANGTAANQVLVRSRSYRQLRNIPERYGCFLYLRFFHR